MISRSTGWVAGADRPVEVWVAGHSLVLRVEGFRDFYISPNGRAILPADGPSELTMVEQEVVLGPGLVLALALGGKWCLHASAVLYNEQGSIFLGESGYGKSTLAAYLDIQRNRNWRRITDDILPVTLGEGSLLGWPHFPQLKLPTEKHPGLALPEKVQINRIYLLTPVSLEKSPTVCLLSTNEAARVLLGHIAGARLFTPELLAAHLDFCAQATRQIAVYRLSYPHRWDILPVLKELLEQPIESSIPFLN